MSNQLANTARKTLIRFGKIFPFVLCSVIALSYIENLYAVLAFDIIVVDGIAIYNTPLSFAIGMKFEYDILFSFVASIISVSVEVCKYNLMAIAYIWLNLIERHILFNSDPYDNEIYYVICISNIIASGYLTLKGIKIYFLT